MHRISEIDVERDGSRRSIITITLRSPELAKALHRSGEGAVIGVWLVLTTILAWLTWLGALGDTAHAMIRFSILGAIIFWVALNANRLWQNRNRVTLYQLVARLDDRKIMIDGPDGGFTQRRNDTEIRFSSRPHRQGKYEEREERRVQRPVGYEYRDAWEVWCEAGTEVRFIIAVSEEVDARAIVRHLTEENMRVSRDVDEEAFGNERAEPA